MLVERSPNSPRRSAFVVCSWSCSRGFFESTERQKSRKGEDIEEEKRLGMEKMEEVRVVEARERVGEEGMMREGEGGRE